MITVGFFLAASPSVLLEFEVAPLLLLGSLLLPLVDEVDDICVAVTMEVIVLVVALVVVVVVVPVVVVNFVVDIVENGASVKVCVGG